MRICRIVSTFVCLVIVLLASNYSTLADELAALTGRITDSQGLVLPDVNVEATNLNTNLHYSAATNNDGLFRISEIPPGLYRVILQKTGFAQIVKPGVELHVQDVITLNFTMRLGSITESVTVESGAPVMVAISSSANSSWNRSTITSRCTTSKALRAVSIRLPSCCRWA